MRAFLAIPLPDDVADALLDVQMEIPAGRLVPVENLHLTLAFLGEEPDAMIMAVHESLADLRLRSFDLTLAGLATFGSNRPANLHIAAKRTAPLSDLHAKLRSRLHGVGLMLPRTRFAPHVTLARFARSMPEADLIRLGHFLARWADFHLEPFPVTYVSLFRSTLGSDAPRYEELAQYPLT